MKITPEEQAAIKSVVAIAKQFGFGNMIAHLGAALADMLIKEQGLSETDAIEYANSRTSYHLQMHRDLLEHGECDQTGRRYTPTTQE